FFCLLNRNADNICFPAEPFLQIFEIEHFSEGIHRLAHIGVATVSHPRLGNWMVSFAGSRHAPMDGMRNGYGYEQIITAFLLQRLLYPVHQFNMGIFQKEMKPPAKDTLHQTKWPACCFQ